MAVHGRKEIRDVVVVSLTGLTTTADRVHRGRVRSLGKDTEPYLLVYSADERSALDAMGSVVLDRQLLLAVEGCAVATEADQLEDLLDTIAAEVEVRMATGESLLSRVREVTLTGTRFAIEAPGERHAGSVRMEYRVVYRTREDAPDVLV